jgi:hypothetical protein
MRSLALTFAFALSLPLAASPAAAQEAPPPAPRPVYAPPAYAPMWWQPMPAPPVLERRNPGMAITGIVLWVAGGIVSGVGAGITAYEGMSRCVYETVGAPASGPAHHKAARGERIGTAQQALDECGRDLPMGAGILAAGVLTSLAGIPLFVIGNGRVKAKPQADTSALPEVRVGATGAAMKWSF